MRAHLMTDPIRKLTTLGLALALSIGVLVAPSPVLAQTPTGEDLRALIYYLDHNDQRSVQAEMRRLRSAFPSWTPPGDINELRSVGRVQTTSVDVAPIWARIERNDFAGARQLIDQSRTQVPGWTPDAEMLRVLETNESQAAFESAYVARDLNGAVAAARRTPSLMRCDRINNAWRLAELYQGAGQNQPAVATYRGVLSSCTRISDVIPTLEKANDVATNDELTQLFTTARQAAPSNGPQLDELEARLRAGRGQTVRRTTTTATAAAAATTTAATPRPRTQTATAAPAPSTPVPAGSLPLRGDNRITRVRQLKESGNWQACLAESTNPRSVEVLYERSWCAYNLDRTGEALAGFTDTARVGASMGGDVQRDARFGMILSYLDMNMTEEGARLAAATNLTREQRVEVEATILDQRGVRAYHAREYGQSIAYFNALEQLTGPLRRDLAMLRAYAYLNNRQQDVALTEFQRLHSELATDETRAAIQSVQGILSSQ
ncbi:MAG: hypothetical protein R3D60_12795 [Paracoccaceae bacterium]